jgi:hypothetical protein
MDELKQIIKILPYEVILLNFLKKTYNDDIREFILNTGNFSMLIGYISKIINYYSSNLLSLFRINNELYINNNLYDYNIKNNEIIPEIYELIKNADIDSFNYKNIFDTYPEFIIIQEEQAEPKETKVFKEFISGKEKVFDIKTYINDNKFLNFFNYNLDIIFFKDCIYFIDNDKKFIYKDGKIELFDWNIDNTNKSILMSVYRLIT